MRSEGKKEEKYRESVARQFHHGLAALLG